MGFNGIGETNGKKPLSTVAHLLSTFCSRLFVRAYMFGLVCVMFVHRLTGNCGMLFAAGLKAQCSLVIERVKGLIELGKILVVNCVGLSRGGIACLYLCQMLADYPDTVSVNMCLFDPVPGNLLTTSRSACQ